MKKVFVSILIGLTFTLGFLGFQYRKHLPYLGRFFRVNTPGRIAQIEDRVLKRFLEQKINVSDLVNQNLIVLVVKDLKEVFVFSENPSPHLVKKYKMTAFSGQLGPKNQEGDKQIPEGIYNVEGLNPNSLYHLSIKLNYPNDIDLKRARVNGINQPGSNIFIHGKRVTVGCIPLGDSGIEELFYLTHKIGKSNTKVLITPSLVLNDFNHSVFVKSPEDEMLLKKKYNQLAKAIENLKID